MSRLADSLDAPAAAGRHHLMQQAAVAMGQAGEALGLLRQVVGGPPRSLSARLAEAAALAVNRLLDQQPSARADLLPHEGQVLRIVVESAAGSAAFGFEVRAGRFEPVDDDRASAVSLRVPLSGALLVDALRDGQAGAMRRVRIDGDAAFAQVVAGLARRLRWDVEGELAGFVGEAAAHRIAGTARALGDQARDLARRSVSAAVSYTVHENPQLVARTELEVLRDDIRTLRDDIERLAKRAARVGA